MVIYQYKNLIKKFVRYTRVVEWKNAIYVIINFFKVDDLNRENTQLKERIEALEDHSLNRPPPTTRRTLTRRRVTADTSDNNAILVDDLTRENNKLKHKIA
ncbi:unnamed protein product, partial [marine sediment metagenome]